VIIPILDIYVNQTHVYSTAGESHCFSPSSSINGFLMDLGRRRTLPTLRDTAPHKDFKNQHDECNILRVCLTRKTRFSNPSSIPVSMTSCKVYYKLQCAGILLLQCPFVSHPNQYNWQPRSPISLYLGHWESSVVNRPLIVRATRIDQPQAGPFDIRSLPSAVVQIHALCRLRVDIFTVM
jgi:hypothetical protein